MINNETYVAPEEIFTPNKFPQKTFVNSHIKEKMQLLTQALRDGDIVSISGPSKSGKTVMVERVASDNNFILVLPSLAGAETVQEVWRRFLAEVNAKYDTAQLQGIQNCHENEISANVKAGIPMLGQAAGTFTHGRSKTTITQTTSDIVVDYSSLLVQEFKGTDFILFIDDFHYLSSEVQAGLAQQIKQISRLGVKIICASIIHREQDFIRSNPDLRGRVRAIDLDYWQTSSLEEIAQKGFDYLHIKTSNNIIKKIASEAAGSPLLMQRLCLEYSLCAYREPAYDTLNIDLPALFKKNAETLSMNSIVTVMKNGPKVHGKERSTYIFKNQKSGDTYHCLILALREDPPQTLFTYNELIDRAKKVCLDRVVNS